MIRTFSIHKLPFNIESLAAKAVKPLILAEVNIACIMYLLKNLFYNCNMRRISGSNKRRIVDIELRPQLPEKLTDFISINPWTQVFFFGCPDNFIPMFIRPGQKEDFVIQHTVKPTGHVSNDGGVGMSQMRPGVNIVNWRGNIERVRHQRVPLDFR